MYLSDEQVDEFREAFGALGEFFGPFGAIGVGAAVSFSPMSSSGGRRAENVRLISK